MDGLISKKWLLECVDEGWIEFNTEKDKNTYIHLVRDIAPSVPQKPLKYLGNDRICIYCENCDCAGCVYDHD